MAIEMGETAHAITSKPGRKAGLLRVGVSVVILLAVFTFAPLDEILARMSIVSPALWIAVFCGFLFGHALAAAKWRWMVGGEIGYRRALKAHFAGLAANLALPGVAGGDIVRAGLVMRGSNRKTALAIGSLADRAIDTAALVVIAAVGAFWLGARAGVHPVALALFASATVGAGLAVVALMVPIAAFIRRRAPDSKMGRMARAVADAMEEMSKRRVALLGCAALSILIQFSFALMNGVIAQSIGAGTTFAAWVFAWPLAKLVATAPISFGGLGVREASLAGLMTPLGYDAAAIVAASLIWQTIQFAAGAIGGLAQIVGPNRDKPAVEANCG